MIYTFELVKPDSVPEERFFALVKQARRIAMEIDGVYDLALYQTEKDGVWQCSVDVDDEQTWQQVQVAPSLRGVWEQMQALGVQIVRQNKLERMI